jgi:hypothetical protein
MVTVFTFLLVTAFTLFGPPPAQYLYFNTADTDPTIHPPIYSKEAATIIKIYTDDQKYNSVSDSFNFKLTIFYNICKRSGLLFKGYITIFPTILKGLV